ncbi:MAG: hypothetical protein E7328_01480 [Clostridiales bacterium]|nr:hypothetical protein [Clostridiales bacterium]
MVILCAILFALCSLWLSGLLPRQIAAVVAKNHLAAHDGMGYSLQAIEFSPYHDGYFAYFLRGEEQRTIGISSQYLPLWVSYDSEMEP